MKCRALRLRDAQRGGGIVQVHQARKLTWTSFVRSQLLLSNGRNRRIGGVLTTQQSGWGTQGIFFWGPGAVFLCSSAGRQSGVILTETLPGSSSSYELDHVSKTCCAVLAYHVDSAGSFFSEIPDSSPVLYKPRSPGLWILLLFPHLISFLNLNYGSWAFNCNCCIVCATVCYP